MLPPTDTFTNPLPRLDVSYTDYTLEERNQLAVRARDGDRRAKHELVHICHNLVMKMAARWAPQSAVEEEVEAAAWVGFMRALRTYDIRKAAFSTHLNLRVRAALQSEFTDTPMERLGLRNQAQRETVRAAMLVRGATNDRPLAELADDSNFLDQVVVHPVCAYRRITRPTVKAVLAALQPMVYPDSAVNRDGDDEARPELYGHSLPESIDRQEVADRRRLLVELFEDYLTPREQQVLTHYYGLLTGEPVTFRQLGALMGMSRQRCQQLHERALSKLKAGVRERTWDLDEIFTPPGEVA